MVGICVRHLVIYKLGIKLSLKPGSKELGRNISIADSAFFKLDSLWVSSIVWYTILCFSLTLMLS